MLLITELSLKLQGLPYVCVVGDEGGMRKEK